jgi:uncharacterized repeat protein (TIGR01451 family)
LQVFLQTATGLASPVLVELFDHEAGAVVIGDFDQDGRNDLAVQSNLSSWDEYEVAVLPNLCGNTADISVAVSHAPEPLGGRELTYTVEVTNNGPDASGVRVLVTLPPEMYLAARTPGCSDRHPIVHCILDNLSGVPPANVASVVLRIATPADGGTFRFATTAVASVPDPDASNDSAEQSVTVLRIGGRGLALTSSDAGVTLTWDDGNAQAGYVVGRAVEGTATFFPSDGGWLPADATEFTDPAPVQGRGNCYMLAPMHATGTGIGTSDLLCVAPGTGLGGVPSAISIRIWRDVVGLSWADVPGTFKLVYKYDPETGESRQVFQTPEASAAFWKEGKVCYAVAFRVGPSYLGYSDLVCAVPMSTLPPP